MDIDKIKQELEKELKSYKKSKTNFKPYMQSMREMSAWISEMSKK